jgi:hypothetical protein
MAAYRFLLTPWTLSIHLALMAGVSVIILGTCLTLLVAPSLV